VVEPLRAAQAEDVLVAVGGTIPAQDIPELKQLGVSGVLTPGAATQDIVDFLRSAIAQRGVRRSI
jgi:methylmalonyl-CoA mutase C-terminal domain/subunit